MIVVPGGVPERLNGAVSKTVVGLWSTEGSNPSPSVSNPRGISAAHGVCCSHGKGALSTRPGHGMPPLPEPRGRGSREVGGAAATRLLLRSRSRSLQGHCCRSSAAVVSCTSTQMTASRRKRQRVWRPRRMAGAGGRASTRWAQLPRPHAGAPRPRACGRMEELTLTAADLSGIVQRKVLQPNDFVDLAALEERLLASSALARRSLSPSGASHAPTSIACWNCSARVSPRAGPTE
jgi:hypothetical protein